MAATNNSSSAAPPAETTRDWASLPWNVLYAVLTHIVSLQEYLQFSFVCKSWKSAAEDDKRRRIARGHKQAPLLLVPTQDRSQERRCLFSAMENNLISNLGLPILHHRRCCGSSHGWLAFAEKDYSVTLYNPFTCAQISLPPIKNLPDTIDVPEVRAWHNGRYPYVVKKAILSADPSVFPHDYVVAAIESEFKTLAVIRAGEKEWKHVTGWADYSEMYNFKYPFTCGLLYDVVFRDDEDGKWVYACGADGLVARAKVSAKHSAKEEEEEELLLEMVGRPWITDLRLCIGTTYRYLVASSDGRDLLMILRVAEEMKDYERSMTTKEFKVFKLREDDKEYDEEVTDLNGDAVFVGDSHSTAVLAREFHGCQPDTIYYSDDFIEGFPPKDRLGPHDMGVFNVKANKFSSHYVPTPTQNLGMPPPIWFLP